MNGPWVCGLLLIEFVLAASPMQTLNKSNESIERGVAYLKHAYAMPTRRIPGTEEPIWGADPLAGLTLVESGVAADDPVVQSLAKQVRAAAPHLRKTYSLVLSILFLDRLRNRDDRLLIWTMAARLLAGQNAGGGWSYDCPSLSASEEWNVLTRREASVQAPIPQVNLRTGEGDNSNTQFAILGVWAARRHGVPVGQSLGLIDARFRGSQNDDGSWGYHGKESSNLDSMTCAGLLGLAVGRGRLQEQTLAPDPAMERGLAYLGKRIGELPGVSGRGNTIVGAKSLGDLYFLWAVERVGMIHNLKTIAGKDWYAWGVPLIVDHQNPDGSWNSGHGPIADTCFALLFLKRVNLLRDSAAPATPKTPTVGRTETNAQPGASDLRLTVGPFPLYRKVVVLQATKIHSKLGDKGEAISPFLVFHKLRTGDAKEEQDEFVRVGNPSGKPVGWIRKAHVLDWDTRLALEPSLPGPGSVFRVFPNKELSGPNSTAYTGLKRGWHSLMPILTKPTADDNLVFNVAFFMADMKTTTTKPLRTPAVPVGFIGWARMKSEKGQEVARVKILVSEKELIRYCSSLTFLHEQLATRAASEDRGGTEPLVKQIQQATVSLLTGQSVSDTTLVELIYALPLKPPVLKMSAPDLVSLPEKEFKTWLDRVQMTIVRIKEVQMSADFMDLSGGSKGDKYTLLLLDELP